MKYPAGRAFLPGFLNITGEIEFKPTDDIPIRTYPVDNDTKGALEIYSMPKKNREGKVFNDRYIIGVDPKSLGLILVIK